MTPTDAARHALAAMDLTSLNTDDTADVIDALCARASSPHGHVAAVCVYPQWVGTARAALAAQGGQAVRIATVTNFPAGAADPELAAEQTRAAVAAGADEVDVVFPWRALQAGDAAVGRELVAAAEAACGETALLKVILETGELDEATLIARASEIAIEAGADFIKTSTGKVPVNATPAAVRTMAEVIRANGSECGLKVAGGVRSTADATAYLQLVDEVLGEGWARPATFRFGASGLLDALLATLEGSTFTSQSGY